MFDLNALRDFIAIVRAQSFAGASRAMNIPKSTLSKRLQTLETDLNTRLIERTTRALRLTPEGDAFYERALRIMGEVEEAHHLLEARSDTPSGKLRISAPHLFGQSFMGELTAAYLARFPNTALEVVLVDRRVDLIEESFDAAIRIGEMPDSNLVAKIFAEVDHVIVATPGAAQQWAVNAPVDLETLPCLAHMVGFSARTNWRLVRGDTFISVAVTPAIAITSLVAIRDAALAGAGLAYLPRFMVQAEITNGRLIHVLKEWCGPKVPISIVYPSARFLSARLKAFIDLLDERFPQRELRLSSSDALAE